MMRLLIYSILCKKYYRDNSIIPIYYRLKNYLYYPLVGSDVEAGKMLWEALKKDTMSEQKLEKMDSDMWFLIGYTSLQDEDLKINYALLNKKLHQISSSATDSDPQKQKALQKNGPQIQKDYNLG